MNAYTMSVVCFLLLILLTYSAYGLEAEQDTSKAGLISPSATLSGLRMTIQNLDMKFPPGKERVTVKLNTDAKESSWEFSQSESVIFSYYHTDNTCEKQTVNLVLDDDFMNHKSTAYSKPVDIKIPESTTKIVVSYGESGLNCVISKQ